MGEKGKHAISTCFSYLNYMQTRVNFGAPGLKCKAWQGTAHDIIIHQGSYSINCVAIHAKNTSAFGLNPYFISTLRSVGT